jgi:hypothetical protein
MPSNRNDNLVNFKNMTPERRKEIASMGGKASGELKKQRKTFKENILLMLDDEKLQGAIIAALLNRAKRDDAIGNSAFETIRDTIGEKQKDVIESNITANISNPFKDLSVEELKKLAGE